MSSANLPAGCKRSLQTLLRERDWSRSCEWVFQDVASTRYVLNLAILEVLNAIYRVHREGHLTEAERDAFVAAFYDDITNGRLLVYSVRDDHIIWGVGRWKRFLMEGAFSKRGQDHGKGNRRNPR